MDANRFDEFTRSLVENLSRRGVLGAIGAGLSGVGALAGLGSHTPLETEARKKRRKKKGKKRKKKCKNGKTKCNGKCRNLNTNENNCGSCGNACEPDEECQNGNCTANCTPDCTNADCGDTDGCGGLCDGDCPPNLTCQSGQCVCTPDCTGAECGDPDGCGGICDGTCPPGLDPVCNVNTGICECEVNGNCCLDSDCAELGPNFVCLNVQNQANCFCNPVLLCGPVGNRVCCDVGETCVGEQCV